MKLTVEISEQIAIRIDTIVSQSGQVSAETLIHRAILNELERWECGMEESRELAALVQQVSELRNGQRALIALVDSSGTVVAGLLRSQSRRR